MKVIVVFKWTRNPQDARIGSDGSVDWKGVKMSVTDDDHMAMEVARLITEEIIGLTIGDGDVSWAAARGAIRTVVVPDVQPNVNSSVTGEILAAAIRREGQVDAVIIGDSSWDNGVVSALAGKLGWPSVAGVVSAEKTGQEQVIRAIRKLGSKSQVLDVKGPALLAVSAMRAEQNPPGMKDILMARKKPVEKVQLADLDITMEDGVNSKGTRFPDIPPARIIDGSDPVAACDQLVATLRADGVL